MLQILERFTIRFFVTVCSHRNNNNNTYNNAHSSVCNHGIAVVKLDSMSECDRDEYSARITGGTWRIPPPTEVVDPHVIQGVKV